jgi:pyrimidine 5'-nucleotidase
MPQPKPLKYLLFDLDGTLYPADGGYVKHTRQQLFQYIFDQGWVEKREDAEAFWRPYFTKYNQTFRGLTEAGVKIDYDDYWATCRRGTADFLKEDKELRSFLESLPAKKYVVSNCNEKEVIEALECLGVLDLFETPIYGAKAMLPYCKPEVEAFTKILDHIGATDPAECCLFEDSYKNCRSASKMGMATVFVESEIHVKEEGVSEKDREELDAVVSTLSDPTGQQLRTQLPRLFM